jgi:hypothetical protein
MDILDVPFYISQLGEDPCVRNDNQVLCWCSCFESIDPNCVSFATRQPVKIFEVRFILLDVQILPSCFISVGSEASRNYIDVRHVDFQKQRCTASPMHVQIEKISVVVITA